MVAALIQLIALAGLLLGLAFLGRLFTVYRQEHDRRSYSVRFPRPVKPEQVHNFLLALAGRASGKDSIVFEVVAEQGQISHRLQIPIRSAEFVQAQLRTAIPGARLTPLDSGEVAPSVTRAWSLWLTRHAVPLNTAQPEALAAALLGSLDPLASGERLVVQWTLTPKRARLMKPERPKAEQSGVWHTVDLLRGTERASEPERRQQLAKLSAPLFAASLRLGVTAATRHRAKQLLSRPYAVLRGLRVPGVDLWPIPASLTLVAKRLNQARVPLLLWPLTLNADELAGVLGIPLGEAVVPGLAPSSARQLPPSPFLPWQGVPLGTATFAHHERPVAISLTDATKHLEILGPTGGGKSTLLHNIFVSIIGQGYGGMVIDPKGDLINSIINTIPPDREQDVILLDPLDGRPPAINLLDCPNPAERELVVDGVVTAFRHRFQHSWGPRLEDCLRVCCQTLTAIPGASLVDVERLLTDPHARRRAMDYQHDAIVRRYWQWYDSLNARAQSEVSAPVLNKIRSTILRPSIARIVGQASTFHFDDVLARRRILLVSVPHGLLGPDTAALVGSLVYQQMWAAIQRRVRLPQAQRTPFIVLLDEFQQFVAGDDSFGESLALARGYGTPIICAHQHLKQLDPALQATVLANARTKLCFALGAHDAAVMAKEFGPLVTPNDLMQLDPYEALVSPHVGSQQLSPVNVATPPPLVPRGRAAAVRDLSRQRYGATRPVEAEVVEPRPPVDDDGPVGRRRLR